MSFMTRVATAVQLSYALANYSHAERKREIVIETHARGRQVHGGDTER